MPDTWYEIASQETGKAYGSTIYATEQLAQQQLRIWKRRHDAGGRPDITQATLDDMVIREYVEG